MGKPSDTVSKVERAVLLAKSQLESGNFAACWASCEALLSEVPNNRDLMYMSAVSLRYMERYSEALAMLDRLEESDPTYGRLFQERGHCLRTLADRKGQLIAYERAVELNPSLFACWDALSTLYLERGRETDAARARAHLEHLRRLPPVLVTVSSMMHEGNLHRAEMLCRHFLQTQGHHLEGMRLLAELGVRLDVLDDAEFLLESVVEFAPQHHLARYDYACVLSRRQKYQKAREQAEILLGLDPSNRSYKGLLAAQAAGLGDHQAAAVIYDDLLKEVPIDPITHLSLGHAQRTLGQHENAVKSYRRSFEQAPEYGDAYWSLANLKTYFFTDEELRRMQHQEGRADIRDVDRYHICFALGKAFEDRREYAESFRYYARGNALKRAEVRYRADLMERDLKLQSSVCTEAFFESTSGAGYIADDPIFIVGLPRAGSTLVEQILASHSRVEGTMELPNIRSMANRLDGRRQIDETPRYPRCLRTIERSEFRRLGEKYIADTRVYRDKAPFFIDKMPNNFRHIGLIHGILPNARIIDVRRDAMACCFSGFKQLFATGQEFTYSLEDIGRYYKDYVALMEHWNRMIPGKILHVRYEDIVDDLETEVRRILEFLELPFEASCLAFHENDRSVRTASSEQVRRPIYGEAVEQWRRYESYLGPLVQALQYCNESPQTAGRR